MNKWIDKKSNQEVNSIEDMPESAIGFIYLIELVDGRKYIGKKSLYSKRKRKFGKKEIAKITDKRKKHWEYVIKESNWKEYCSSNKELKELIKQGIKYHKYILDYAYTKKELSYKEEKQLFINEVLESKIWFNSNISGRYFKMV